MTRAETRPAIEGEATPVKTVAVVIIDKENVLVVRHSFGTTAGEGIYGLPGGQQHEGETEQETAERELIEETGLSNMSDLVEFPGNRFNAKLSFNGDQPKEASLGVYICTEYDGSLMVLPKTKPEWVLIKDLNLIYPTMPNVLEAIANAQKFLKTKNPK